MRIPREKLYRAFHSLDDFTDEQCEFLMHRVRLGGRRVALIYVVPALFVFVGCPVSGAAALIIDDDLSHDYRYRSIHALLLFGVLIAFPWALALLSRDLLLFRFLRRAITFELKRVRCPTCRHLLIAETPDGDRVMCRECGRQTTLYELGLEPGDLPMTTDRGALVMEGRRRPAR